MQAKTTEKSVLTDIEKLTGMKIETDPKAIKGRNVWGRVAFNRTGKIHVEIMPKDKLVNAVVMPTISPNDMALGSEERIAIYRSRCKEEAASMNAKAVKDNNLILLVSSNGHLTKTAKALIDALL